MPELPEVETVRRGLIPAMEGARILQAGARRPDLRFPLSERFCERLSGARVAHLARRAKYLLAHLDTGEVLLMHLGMSGSFRIIEGSGAAGKGAAGTGATPGEFHFPRGAAHRHDHIVFVLSSGKTVVFNDPRRFGFMKLVPEAALATEPHLRALGPEPLDADFTGAVLHRAFAGKKTSLKAALLDQRVVAGLGNIYVCEALHRARLSPRRQASTLAAASPQAKARCDALVAAIKAVLRDAIEAGGSSLRDHRQTNGELGYFQHRFRAYDREGEACPTKGCKGIIRRIVQNGRSTFFCPVCQT